MGCSVLFHVGTIVIAVVARWAGTLVMAVMAALFPWCASDPSPIIQDSLEVAVVSLPKSPTKMPERAAAAPKQEGEKPAPVEKPPPVRESDLVHRVEKPPPDPGNSKAPTREIPQPDQKLQDLVEDFLDAPEGPVDRSATSPEGTGDLAMATLSAEAMGDPEYARWFSQIQQLYRSKFNALGNTSGLRAIGSVTVDPDTGKVLKRKLTQPSGTLVFDSAAERAMGSVTEIPLPPEKYRAKLNFPLLIEFTPN